jgi:hypothetical protein
MKNGLVAGLPTLRVDETLIIETRSGFDPGGLSEAATAAVVPAVANVRPLTCKTANQTSPTEFACKSQSSRKGSRLSSSEFVLKF